MPYWTAAQVTDVVGLNYPEAAVRPPTVDDVKRLKPDVVFLHQGTSLMNDVLIPVNERGGKIYPISPPRLGSALLPSRRAVLDRHVTSYDKIGLLNVQYAATVLIEYLSESSDYDILVVDPNERHSFVHVWGFKKDWPLRDEAVKSLAWSVTYAHYQPYLEVRRLLAARPKATEAAF